MTKRYKYTTNPFTGQREKVLKHGYYRDPFTSTIKGSKFNKIYTYKNNRLNARRVEGFYILVIASFILFSLIFIDKSQLTQILGGLFFVIIIIVVLILIFNVLKRLIESNNSKDKEINQLITTVKDMNIQTLRSEEDFEKQLYQWLSAKGFNVKRRVLMNNKKINMVINSKIGLELKLAEKTKNVLDLVGQMKSYKNLLNKFLVVIYDIGNVENIDEMISWIEDVNPNHIFVTVLKGSPEVINRYKTKEEFYVFKKRMSK